MMRRRKRSGNESWKGVRQAAQGNERRGGERNGRPDRGKASGAERRLEAGKVGRGHASRAPHAAREWGW